MIGNKKILAAFAIIAFALIGVLFFSPADKEEKIFEDSAEISTDSALRNYSTEVLVTGLDTPWAIDFLPDGRMIFTERPGKVSIFDGRETKVIAEIEVSEVSESGLMGIAVNPEFDLDENSFIYLYYTHESGNRISRFEFAEDKLTGEVILIDNIPNARFHDGGRIKFGPDGKLYATTGDATIPSTAQDLNSLAGKILRINKDGTVPEDNPYGNYVWSYGHRNPQGIAWNSRGELYSAEHGPIRNDEVNFVEKGKNYGWPQECIESGDFVNPVRCFTEFTLAPGGIAFLEDNLYVVGLRGSQLRKLEISGGKVAGEEIVLDTLGRLREVIEYNGSLYISTSNYDGRGIPRPGDDKIIKLSFTR